MAVQAGVGFFVKKRRKVPAAWRRVQSKRVLAGLSRRVDVGGDRAHQQMPGRHFAGRASATHVATTQEPAALVGS
jgi:hypothetical protein